MRVHGKGSCCACVCHFFIQWGVGDTMQCGLLADKPLGIDDTPGFRTLLAKIPVEESSCVLVLQVSG